MVKFLILLPSYNRPSLVIRAVSSLLAQTYPHFDILLIDNGSEQPVRQLLKPLIDPRVKLIRNEQNVRSFDEDILMAHMSGCSHFLFLGDDDALMPQTLEVVARIFEQNPRIEMLGVGLTSFDHTTGEYDFATDVACYTGKLKAWDAKMVALSNCNIWGIGPKQVYPTFPRGHPSGTFISAQLIERTRLRQGKLLIEHFGDVGYVGAAFNTDKIYYLGLPLAIVGKGISRDSDASRAGQRHSLQNAAMVVEYTPLRAISFTNLAVDTHLRVLYRNGLQATYDCRLRPDFYFNHLREIVSDSPWTGKTLRDIGECVPHIIISLFQFLTFRDILFGWVGLLKWPWRIVRRLARRSFHPKDMSSPQAPVLFKFKDINAFAEWVDDTYVKPLVMTSQISIAKCESDVCKSDNNGEGNIFLRSLPTKKTIT